jgi:hypothetical protein
MGTAACRDDISWLAGCITDVHAFVDEVLVELAIMARDGALPVRSGPNPSLAGAAPHEAVMPVWCVCFCWTAVRWRHS